jgi:hypothetical protein
MLDVPAEWNPLHFANCTEFFFLCWRDAQGEQKGKGAKPQTEKSLHLLVSAWHWDALLEEAQSTFVLSTELLIVKFLEVCGQLLMQSIDAICWQWLFLLATWSNNNLLLSFAQLVVLACELALQPLMAFWFGPTSLAQQIASWLAVVVLQNSCVVENTSSVWTCRALVLHVASSSMFLLLRPHQVGKSVSRKLQQKASKRAWRRDTRMDLRGSETEEGQIKIIDGEQTVPEIKRT